MFMERKKSIIPNTILKKNSKVGRLALFNIKNLCKDQWQCGLGVDIIISETENEAQNLHEYH